MIKYIVTGTRDLNKTEVVREILYSHISQHDHDQIMLIHGDCRGVDFAVKEYAGASGISTKEYQADWVRYGKSAGPIRNRLMLNENRDGIVLAFPGRESRGTYNCITQATNMGMKVYIYPI